MRTGHLVTTLALLAAAAGSAAAQEEPGGAAAAGATRTASVDVGGRLSGVSGDEARFQRYRDLRDGPFLENVRYGRDEGSWLFDAALTHVGYRDQRYQASYNRIGKVRAWFEWDQVPLFYSVDTRTPYVEQSAGVLRIDDAVQQAGNLAVVAAAARPFDLRQRRDVARFGFLATPSEHLDVTANVTTSRRGGEMPWAGTFGFGNVVELAAPLDQRTTDLNAAAEWGSDRGSVRVQYDGSWFSNDVQTLVWDNPLRLVDSPTAGSSQGRMALWPDSTLHAVSVTGTARLPRRSRGTAYVSVGSWRQDQELLPFTVNTALPSIPLDRQTADARAVVTALNLTFTSRPVDRLWLSARYRQYDFDNQTPAFRVTSTVAYDQSLRESILASTAAFGYIRHSADLDASFELTRFAALRVGYGLDDVERSFRLTESTTEHAFRASVDSTGNQYVSVRAVYEHSTRSGSGLDEEVLDELGEQISLRQFDISDRNRDRVSAIVQVIPLPQVGLSGTVGLGRDERPDALFGLQEARTRFYSVGIDVTPHDRVSGGILWGYDRYATLQRSRQASAGVEFDDPTRDWSTDAADRVHYVSANLGVNHIVPKTDVQIGYDFNRSRGRYLYLLPPNSSLATPRQLPEVMNELQRATVDVKYFLNRRLAAGLVYWFDKYAVDDFALGPGTVSRVNMPSSLLLGSVWRPYTASTVWARLTYLW